MKLNFLLYFILFLLGSCSLTDENDSGKIRVVTTTSIVTDIVKNIGGDKIEVSGLMGAGIDPHLYKASEGDVMKLANAEMIIYGGLHLEGKLVDVFSKIERLGKHPVDLGATIPEHFLHRSKDFGGNYDPHVWFNVELIKIESKSVAEAFKKYDSINADYYQANLDAYLVKLDDLQAEIIEMVQTLPKESRHLVTAHDAFGYFGDAYGFKVIGLQGLSTATEAGVKDMRRVSDYIVKHHIKSIFIESSVPVKTIEALQMAVRSRGHQVNIGGMLYSDALGNEGEEEGTYIGMMRYNVKSIIDGLK